MDFCYRYLNYFLLKNYKGLEAEYLTYFSLNLLTPCSTYRNWPLVSTILKNLNKTVKPILADIRDIKKIEGVIKKFRPDIVFHAAALKHITFVETDLDVEVPAELEQVKV